MMTQKLDPIMNSDGFITTIANCRLYNFVGNMLGKNENMFCDILLEFYKEVCHKPIFATRFVKDLFGEDLCKRNLVKAKKEILVGSRKVFVWFDAVGGIHLFLESEFPDWGDQIVTHSDILEAAKDRIATVDGDIYIYLLASRSGKKDRGTIKCGLYENRKVFWSFIDTEYYTNIGARSDLYLEDRVIKLFEYISSILFKNDDMVLDGEERYKIVMMYNRLLEHLGGLYEIWYTHVLHRNDLSDEEKDIMLLRCYA